jgi:hypothetical protein
LILSQLRSLQGKDGSNRHGLAPADRATPQRV